MTRNDVALAALAAIISKAPYGDPCDGTTRRQRIAGRVEAAFVYADAFAEEQEKRAGHDGSIRINVTVDARHAERDLSDLVAFYSGANY